jgi:hypothetical protein
VRAFKFIGNPIDNLYGRAASTLPTFEEIKPVTTVLEKSDLLSRLDALEPVKRTNKGGGGRPPAYSVADVEAFYSARSRGISWAQINGVLDKPLKRPGSLAQSVHAAAERHGIPTQRAARAPKKVHILDTPA